MGMRGFRGVIAVAVAMAGTAGLVAACAPPVPELALPPSGGVVGPVTPAVAAPLHLDGTRLVDAEGRTVLLHGMNAVAKSEPFVVTDVAGMTSADRAYIVGNGFNSVRLGVSYAALMPQPGVVDRQYLDLVTTTVDQLSAAGVWVLLDFHQDVFWMMPDWATPPDALALSDQPPAIVSFIGWAAGYLSPRSIRQWEAFVSGERFVQGRSVASWLGEAGAALADRMRTRSHVIGIELLNEPFPGEPVVRCILEGCGDRDNQLADRYAEMISIIRATAPDTAVWVEPFSPTGYAAAGSIPSRPVPPTSKGPQIGVAWHMYCYGTDRGGSVPAPSDIERTLCEQRFRQGFDNGAMLSRDLDAPAVLDEFGAADQPLDAAIVTRTADEQLVSWMYWHLPGGIAGLDSALPDAVEAQIIRPYPQATAGTIRSLSFDPVGGRFVLRYLPDPAVTAPTAVVVPGRQYPAGYDVTVEGGHVTSADQAGTLTVVADGTAEVTVTLTRR